LAFEGKGIGIKSVVLQGVDTALSAKRTKKVNIVFGRFG
jgi:hypothetical protein